MIAIESVKAKAKHHREQQGTFAEQAMQHEQEAARCRQLSIVHQGAAECAEAILKEAAESEAEPPKTE